MKIFLETKKIQPGIPAGELGRTIRLKRADGQTMDVTWNDSRSRFSGQTQSAMCTELEFAHPEDESGYAVPYLAVGLHDLIGAKFISWPRTKPEIPSKTLRLAYLAFEHKDQMLVLIDDAKGIGEAPMIN